MKEVSNILVLSQLGVETGGVLADILLGRANPSGKLTTTWASWEDYCREGEFGDINIPATKGDLCGIPVFLTPLERSRCFPSVTVSLHLLRYPAVDWGGRRRGHHPHQSRCLQHRRPRQRTEVECGSMCPRLRNGWINPIRIWRPFPRPISWSRGASRELTISFSLGTALPMTRKGMLTCWRREAMWFAWATAAIHPQPAALVDLVGEAVVTKAGNCLGETDFEGLEALRQ